MWKIITIYNVIIQKIIIWKNYTCLKLLLVYIATSLNGISQLFKTENYYTEKLCKEHTREAGYYFIYFIYSILYYFSTNF